jgi:hypothetical protein
MEKKEKIMAIKRIKRIKRINSRIIKQMKEKRGNQHKK